jgi:hypothetical protein
MGAMKGEGAVAQLGERGVRNAEARGSIPLCSTGSPIGYRRLKVVCVIVYFARECVNNIGYGAPRLHTKMDASGYRLFKSMA